MRPCDNGRREEGGIVVYYLYRQFGFTLINLKFSLIDVVKVAS